jgi:diguanylate cyclase (GGDEF)-like protein
MKSLRILQFEDAAVDQLLVAELLHAANSMRFALTQVERLEDGLSHLRNDSVDAILLDLSLPDSHGTATFMRVHAAAPETPILVLTGFDDDALGADLVKAGAQDFLPKNEMSGGMLARAIRYSVERKQMQETLRHLAWHDALTGLPNRTLLADRTQQLIALARRSDEAVAALFIDLDGFKGVNDKLGHDAGDAVLRTTAERLSATLRKSDTVARLGGDEFVVVAPQVACHKNAAQLADKLLKCIAQPITIGPRTVAIGASIGISFYPEHGDTCEALLRAADSAMYTAKRGAHNGFAFAALPDPAVAESAAATAG